MSLNKFTDVSKGYDLKLNIGCQNLKVDDLEVLGDNIQDVQLFESYLGIGVASPSTTITTADDTEVLNLSTAMVTSQSHECSVSSSGVVTYSGLRSRTLDCSLSFSYTCSTLGNAHFYVVSSNTSRYPLGLTSGSITFDAGTVPASIGNSISLGNRMNHSMNFTVDVTPGDTLTLYVSVDINASDIVVSNLNFNGRALPNSV